MAVSTTDFAPAFSPTTHNDTSSAESAVIQSIIKSLKMIRHPEGGYFAETDRDSRLVSNPFSDGTSLLKGNDSTRSASTTIFYLVTPGNPFGAFHRNKARTVHTLHKGRGRYVVIHADEEEGRDGNNPRIETFVVGHNIEKGETLQWIVEGGKYKASFLLPDDEDSAGSREGLLISETVVPGFEYRDHDFLTRARFEELVGPQFQSQLSWLVRRDEASGVANGNGHT